MKVRLYRILFGLLIICTHVYASADQATIASTLININEEQLLRAQQQESDWLFVVYMAADNNLSYFAWSNIKQMSNIGSNQNIKIVVQLNEPGVQKKTQRYLIEKNKAIPLNSGDIAAGKKLDTGDPRTLINFCTETIAQFPARHICLVLWDHGTGYLDPVKAKVVNLHELFQLNPTDMMLELNRGRQFFADRIECKNEVRGICFDETFHSYLSNQKVDFALKTITTKLNRKFDIIGLDACMMQMAEFGCLLHPYAHFMVGSQEVELGAGWNYKYILAPFANKSFTTPDLAKHIVQCYQKTYSRLTHDYTLSAANLDLLPALEANLNTVGALLAECINKQIDQSVYKTLQICRSKQFCTCFDEPSYVDLGNLYANIVSNLSQFKVTGDQKLLANLETKINEGLALQKTLIIDNVCGKNLKNATGISIYFPEKRLHASYQKTPFATTNSWARMVFDFLS